MTDRQVPARWTDEVRRGARRGARLPTRSEMRELVAEHRMEIREVEAVGANPQQLTLDHREKIRAYAALLSRDDAAKFMRMYTEETTAAASQPASDTKLLATPPTPAPLRRRALLAVGAIVALLVAVIVLRACS